MLSKAKQFEILSAILPNIFAFNQTSKNYDISKSLLFLLCQSHRFLLFHEQIRMAFNILITNFLSSELPDISSFSAQCLRKLSKRCPSIFFIEPQSLFHELMINFLTFFSNLDSDSGARVLKSILYASSKTTRIFSSELI